jgi:hypothetical protein
MQARWGIKARQSPSTKKSKGLRFSAGPGRLPPRGMKAKKPGSGESIATVRIYEDSLSGRQVVQPPKSDAFLIPKNLLCRASCARPLRPRDQPIRWVHGSSLLRGVRTGGVEQDPEKLVLLPGMPNVLPRSEKRRGRNKVPPLVRSSLTGSVERAPGDSARKIVHFKKCYIDAICTGSSRDIPASAPLAAPFRPRWPRKRPGCSCGQGVPLGGVLRGNGPQAGRPRALDMTESSGGGPMGHLHTRDTARTSEDTTRKVRAVKVDAGVVATGH